MKYQGPDSTILTLLDVYPKCVMKKDVSGKTILHIVKDGNISTRVIRKGEEVMESMEKLVSSRFQFDKSDNRAHVSSLSTIRDDYFEERQQYFRSQRWIRISSINLNAEY